jgi:hypothetical protein
VERGKVNMVRFLRMHQETIQWLRLPPSGNCCNDFSFRHAATPRSEGDLSPTHKALFPDPSSEIGLPGLPQTRGDHIPTGLSGKDVLG